MDVADALDERGLMPLLEACVDRGVLLAPDLVLTGPLMYACFTSVELKS